MKYTRRQMILMGVAFVALLAVFVWNRLQAPPAPSVSSPQGAVSSTSPPSTVVDLGSLMVQPGDLPSGVTASVLSARLPPLFADITKPDRVAYRTLDQDANLGTGVTLLLYTSPADRIRAYQSVLHGFGANAKPIGNIGEQAYLVAVAGALSATEMQAKEKPVMADLAFQRCQAVVHIRMRSPKAENEIKTYAQRLDERLLKAVC